jgi:hypothetical protein
MLFVMLLAATTPRRIPWWLAIVGLPGLFAIWANAHGSVIAGLAWLAVVAVGRTVEWWRSGEDERPTAGRYLLALILSAGATCLNPDGPEVYLDAFRTAKSPNIYGLPAWQPIDFSKGTGMPWGYFATLAAMLVTQLFSRRVLGPTGLLATLTFGFWPVLQQRGLGCWWLIVPWLVVPLLCRRREPEPEASARAEAPSGAGVALADASGSAWPSIVRRVAVGLFVFALFTTPAIRFLVFGPRQLVDIVSAGTPAQLAKELTAGEADAGRFLSEFHETIRAAYPDGRYRGAILTGEEQGDFLAWVLEGDNTRPVMVYSRPETFDTGTWAEAHGALDGVDAWWEILGRHQVNLIAINPRRWEKLAGRLRRSPNWRMVEDGPTLLVAVRREPKLPVELQP